MKRTILSLVITVFSLVGMVHAQSDQAWTLQQGEKTYLQTPPEWLDLNNAALINTTMSQLLQVNPALEFVLQPLLPQIQAGTFDLMLLDPASSSFVNVTASPSDPSATLEDTESDLLKFYASLGVKILENETLALPAGDALLIHLQTTLVDDSGETITRETLQYILLDGTETYTVTLATDAKQFKQIAPDLDQIVQSFGIGTAPDDVIIAGQATPTAESGNTSLDPVETLPSAGGEVSRFSTDDVSIVAPSNWLNMADGEAILEMLQATADTDPDLLSAAQTARDQLESGNFAMVLIDPVTRANFNVVINDLGFELDPADAEGPLRQQYTSMNVEVTDAKVLEVPAGKVLRLDLIGLMDQQQIQYILTKGTTAYYITFTVREDFFEDYEAIFQDMINTFRILD